MKRIIIWGTSIKARRLLKFLNYQNIEVIGFTDNNLASPRMDNFMEGYPYMPWEDILQKEYDYIIIASDYFCEITDQLLFNHVPEEKIIQIYNCQYMLSDALFFFNKLETDEEKYKLFTRFSTFVFEAGVGHV